MLKSTEIDKSIFYKWNLHNSKTMSGVRRTWVVCCLFWGFKRVMNKAIAGDKDMQLFCCPNKLGELNPLKPLEFILIIPSLTLAFNEPSIFHWMWIAFCLCLCPHFSFNLMLCRFFVVFLSFQIHLFIIRPCPVFPRLTALLLRNAE